MSGYWDPHIERMPLEDLHALQEDRLKSIVRYVYDHSPFYRKRFKEAGIEPGNIKTLSDVTKLPFTRKSPGRITAMLCYSAAPEDYAIILLHWTNIWPHCLGS